MYLLKCVLKDAGASNYYIFTFRDEGDMLTIRLEDLLDNYFSVAIYPTGSDSDSVYSTITGLPNELPLDVNETLDLIEETLKELTPVVCMEVSMRK